MKLILTSSLFALAALIAGTSAATVDCKGCNFETIIGGGSAAGTTLHESAECISDLFQQYPAASWDYTQDSEIQIRKTQASKRPMMKGFISIDELKSGYPKNVEGGFSVQKHKCSNGVKVTVDCLVQSCR